MYRTHARLQVPELAIIVLMGIQRFESDIHTPSMSRETDCIASRAGLMVAAVFKMFDALQDVVWTVVPPDISGHKQVVDGLGFLFL